METLAHSSFSLLFFFLIALLALLIVTVVFRRLGTEPLSPLRLEISITDLGGFSYRQLLFVSLLSLFLEMLMIRWVTSEISIFAYFKNFVLLACFLGFGLGCYLSRFRIRLVAFIAPLLLLTIILNAPVPALRQAMNALPFFLGGGVEVNVWGVPSIPPHWTGTLLAMVVVVPVFATVATSFIPFGQLVGWYLENAPNGVTAYSANVLAGLAGIGAYTLLCFLSQPPIVWFSVAGVLSVALFWNHPAARTALAATFVVCMALLAIPTDPQAQTFWSPYQKLGLLPVYGDGQLEAYDLNTNGGWHQRIFNLSPSFVQSNPQIFLNHPVEWSSYNLPYRLYASPPSVLVLGSGMGNDVAAALRNGAGSVVAVEIDPLILRLGREKHFEHPYQSPRTHIVNNDARSYIENSHDQFDLIVFSLLDSHTTSSNFTNIRIDNYVYTREAMERASRLLRPDGLFIVKFRVDNPWIAGRLFHLMHDAFGQDPLQFQSTPAEYDTYGRFFVAGSRERLAKATSDPAIAAYLASHRTRPFQPTASTTDDWPYFYQHEPGLPLIVILVSLAILIIFGWFLRQASGEGAPLDWHFLFLGAGFMLLEAQIVSKMALLFGTTWAVNAVVVSGLLFLIVAANLLYGAFPKIPLAIAYSGLFLSLAVMYLVPLEKLFFESWPVRALLALLALCTPVFFAGIIFISSFSRARFRGSALGSNLFGALLGGLLESLSLWFGLKSLTIIAAILYLGSAIFLRHIAASEDRPAVRASIHDHSPATSR